MKSLILYSLVALAFGMPPASAQPPALNHEKTEFAELAPLPEAKELLIDVAAAIDSDRLRAAIHNDRTLQLMREAVRTSLFHLNFIFEVENADYPYEPPYKQPLPMRPTLEAMAEAARFFELVTTNTGFDVNQLANITTRLNSSPLYARLKPITGVRPTHQIQPKKLSRKDILRDAVNSYDIMQHRLLNYGEVASFPEFADTVTQLFEAFLDPEVQKLCAAHPAFRTVVREAENELQIVSGLSGSSTKLQAESSARYPYRRTAQAIENAVSVMDLKARLLYPESTNWHQVEASWLLGKDQKLLGLYHFNRYKYQMFALLADPEVVLWPYYGEASIRDLLRLRSVPIAMLGAVADCGRADRHFNSPKDFYYHDINHFRRMWAYDKLKLTRLGAKTREEKLAVYASQKAFIDGLLEQLKASPDRVENQLRKMEVMLMFETEHETALTPDADSFRKDIERRPQTRQPFEVQVQAKIADLESIRTFDGNLRSGADNLRLNMAEPTIVRYFWDRAPGFLANVDNKLRWGFYDSVFDVNPKILEPMARIPIVVAEAAHRLLARLNVTEKTPLPQLVRQITDRSGQPELWAYFNLRDAGLISKSRLEIFNVIAARQIHDNWRRVTPRQERWLPVEAKLSDGARVIDDATLAQYLLEQKVPKFLHGYYRTEVDSSSGNSVMVEDIRNLPFEHLGPGHQTENVMSGGKALSIVDRIWQGKAHFRNLDDVERWLIAGVQIVHQAVLERNGNGSRLNHVYAQPWILLPKINQRHDLDLLQIAFDARASLDPKSLPDDQFLLFQEGMLRLLRKIQEDTPFRTCSQALSQVRDQGNR